MIIGLIPARGGSKRLPRKNILPFNGRPLIAWTILEAAKSAYLDEIFVSTEDEEISLVSQSYGVDIIRRPLDLAVDTAPMYPTILHAIKRANLSDNDAVCLLHPTSPLRRYEDIDACCSLLSDSAGARAVVSVTDGKTEPNGAVYVGRVDWLKSGGNFDVGERLLYEMPPDRSFDINTREDFDAAEKSVTG